jgi:hypothetical protein
VTESMRLSSITQPRSALLAIKQPKKSQPRGRASFEHSWIELPGRLRSVGSADDPKPSEQVSYSHVQPPVARAAGRQGRRSPGPPSPGPLARPSLARPSITTPVARQGRPLARATGPPVARAAVSPRVCRDPAHRSCRRVITHAALRRGTPRTLRSPTRSR